MGGSLDAHRHANPQDSVGQRGDALPASGEEGTSDLFPGIAVAADGFSFPRSPAAVTVLAVPCRTWSHPHTLLLKKVLGGGPRKILNRIPYECNHIE